MFASNTSFTGGRFDGGLEFAVRTGIGCGDVEGAGVCEAPAAPV
jgi:hypothetical protein